MKRPYEEYYPPRKRKPRKRSPLERMADQLGTSVRFLTALCRKLRLKIVRVKPCK